MKELGSWHVDDSPNLNMNRRLVVDENGYPVAKLCYRSDPDEMDFLANLLARVPDMVKALKRIAEMSPGTSCDTDDGCSYYTSECGTCDEMISTAKEALEKCGIEVEL